MPNTKTLKTKNYVVRCIKSNNNRFLFGSNHKKGQFVTYNGTGTKNIENAHIYNKQHEPCGLDECAGNWEDYYEYVPVNLIPVNR